MPSPAALPAQFVYYRVPHATRQAAALAVQAMQATLAKQWPGLQVQLMCRADAAAQAAAQAGPAEDTWMETYAHPAGVSEAMAAAIAAQASALPNGLIGARHVETFVPLTVSLPVPPVTPTV